MACSDQVVYSHLSALNILVEQLDLPDGIPYGVSFLKRKKFLYLMPGAHLEKVMGLSIPGLFKQNRLDTGPL